MLLKFKDLTQTYYHYSLTNNLFSVHSGTAMGLDWPELDKKGFAMVEKSFLHFGLKSFSMYSLSSILLSY